MQDKKRFSQSLFYRLLWSAFLWTIAVAISAQKIPFDNYTILNGLPQNTVSDIDQDHMGYLWFATQVGVARFDGYTFEIFNTSNGLPDDFVNCLLVDQKGHVWIGTAGGIAVFNGSEFRTITESDGLVSNRIDKMVEDVNGNVWITSAYGISVLTADAIINYTSEDALFRNTILDIYADSKGRVHVATSPGLTVFDNVYEYSQYYPEELIRDIVETKDGDIWYATQDNGILVRGESGSSELGYHQGLEDETVLSLLSDHQGRIWCGTYLQGLYLYEDGVFRKVKNSYGIDPIAAQIHEDSFHRIWIRTFDDGVWLYDENEVQYLSDDNGLLESYVFDMFEDRYGNMWFTTLGGASKYGRVIFETYGKDLGLPDNITSVFYDSRDRIWFGTTGQLMYKKGRDINIVGEMSGDLQGTSIFSFAEDKYRNIYIGTDLELLYYNGRSISIVEWNGKGPGYTYGIYNSLLYASDERLWCATDSGIYIKQGDRVDVLGENEGLINARVNSLLELDGIVCCATQGGISIFDLDGRHIRNISSFDGLPSDVCYDLVSGQGAQIWLATNRGVSRINISNGNVINNYDTRDGLSSHTTYFLEFADSASLWIGTERGINVLNIESEGIDFYGYEDGFRSLETNERAVSKGENGELWIGSVAGLVHYKPDYNIKDDTPPDLILYPPLVDGELFEYSARGQSEEVIDLSEVPSFAYNRNSLLFSFTGIHTTIPSKNRFSFFLDGYDENWSEPLQDRSVHYRKLPNGNYVFRVKAINLDGVEVEAEANFAFSIKPPFWKTIWFILFEILIGISLIYATIKYRERQLIREKRVLEVKVKERTREIEDQKMEIEAQRDEISEQKNYVENQRDQIANQNKEITDSIIYAKRIQHAVLPGKYILERTLPEHFILFKPRDIVSGDFYWVEEKNEQIIVCAADCTGHGVPGAFMSLLGLTFLNEIVNKDEILKAGEILDRLRTYIIRSMSTKGGSSQGRDGMDMSLIVLDKQLRMLEYAGAYNPLLIIRGEEMIEQKANKMPVGKHEGEEGPFTSHRISLMENDMIYLFSDGFPDQFGGEKGSKYKARPFKRFLHKISSESVADQKMLLDKEIVNWMGKEDQVDDILVMGIRFKE